MSYKCEILADSINEQGHRLTTFKVTYPRIIHAEMLRHRMLSRNVASSRAIPFEKMVKDVEKDPFIPIAWQKHHSGMQGSEYWTEEDEVKIDIGDEFEYIEDIQPITEEFKIRWLEARDKAVNVAVGMNNLGLTKQLCNRLLEPFVWTTELISGTEWGNFFELRCPKYHYDLEDKYFRSKKDWLEYYKKNCIGDVNSDFTLKEEDWFNINKSQAEIHIQKIAEMMWDEMNLSVPKKIKPGEWHIPNLGHEWGKEQLISIAHTNLTKYNKEYSPTSNEIQAEVDNVMIKISTAHCAKISYDNFGTKVDYGADIKLHDRLLGSKHLSCFEHCARAMSEEEYESFYKGEGVNKEHTGLNENKGWCNNYRGFIQYRYLVENQYPNTSKFNM